ncbi:MAG: tetratricopeptide repeat protein [Phycisphaerales bacterium]
MMNAKRTLPAVLSTAVLLSLVGCTGQGNYTREGVSMAKERMSFLKSATEWELARQAFLAGDLEKALRKVDTSLEINDTVVKSHVLKGRILIEMGNLGTALESLKTAAALDPEEPDAQYYLGIVYERINEPELARESFERACDLDDYNPVYAVAAAEMMIDLDRVEEAKVYLGSIPMAENNAGIRQSLGHIALIEQDPAKAVQYFQQARLLAPDDAGIAEDLIHAQILAGKWREAERNIALLLKKPENKDRQDLMILHAKALMNTGRAVEARTIYQEMVSQAEGRSDVEGWIGLANASLMVGDSGPSARPRPVSYSSRPILTRDTPSTRCTTVRQRITRAHTAQSKPPSRSSPTTRAFMPSEPSSSVIWATTRPHSRASPTPPSSIQRMPSMLGC